MDETTFQRLNALNQAFYRTTADAFDQTRGGPWPGWRALWERLPIPPPPGTCSVLDVGCGNARLGVFLAERLPSGVSLRYHGLDTDAALLARAAEALAERGVAPRLERRDVLSDPPGAGAYDLVALFGVLHHIPGAARRVAFVRALAERVAAGGVLAFTCWRFYEYARFRERIVPWPQDLAGAVEAGDYLLDWRQGARALRYCHYVDDAEQAALVAAAEAAGLRVLATYRADGRSADANLYTLLGRPGVAEA
jgi:SAM-dependent methyltransferase